MKVLFAGTPANAAEILKGIVAAGHDVVAVLTREDAPIGRKKIITPSAVAQVADELGIRLIKANRINAEVSLEILQSKADLAIVVAYGIILRQETLDLLPFGWFNLHFSILPKWRGAAPVQRSIEAGDTETGVTLFKIDVGLDTGPVVSRALTPIGPDETAGELISRLTKLGLTLINAELPAIYADRASFEPQQGESSSATKPSRADAKISFSLSSKQIEDLVRAMNPEPMAWCLFHGEPLRVIRARASQLSQNDANSSMQIGVICQLDGKVLVSCGSKSLLELLEVQPASRSVMSVKAWANGLNELGVLS
jgi:methionyl-tRNA formyltransferase